MLKLLKSSLEKLWSLLSILKTRSLSAVQDLVQNMETEIVDLLADYFGSSRDYILALITSGSLYVIGGQKMDEPLIGIKIIGAELGNQRLSVRINEDLDDLKITALVFILKNRYPNTSQYSNVMFAYNPATSRVMEGAEAATYLKRTTLVVRKDLN